MQYHAFLSYSHRDKDMMRRIRHDLTAAGLQVWTDETLVPGTASWKNAIEDAIQQSLTLVVILSPDAKHSDWIEKEIDYARACNVPVLPVLARGKEEISAVPFELINVQRIDLRADYRMGVQQLVLSIRAEGDVADGSFAAPQNHAGTATLEELNPISIYDHIRLFVWIFWQPQKLQVYHDMYGELSIRKTAAWLVSDLVWVAFLAPAIGMVLGTVQVQVDAPITNNVMQALSGVVFLGGWFVTGWIGWRKEPVYAMILLVGTALIVTALFASVATFSGVVLTNQGGMTRPAFVILTGIMLSAAAGIAFRMTHVAAASVAGLLLGSLLFNAIFGVQLHLDGGIAAFLMFVTAILVSYVVDNSLKTGERTGLNQLAFGLIVITGAFMIVVYFLGGWILLQNIGTR